MKGIPDTWEFALEGGTWVIRDQEGRQVATVAKGKDAEARARFIAMSPYVFKALKGLVALVGKEDLEDNGELSGAAICDMARQAVALLE
ncbi:MAG: hypothetical protein JW753_05680 [Dehalococcoidia bacterium]|nr:hypothetical protein [Dehalococcoidia bacterium]